MSLKDIWEDGHTLWQALFKCTDPDKAKAFSTYINGPPQSVVLDALLEAVQGGNNPSGLADAQRHLKAGEQLRTEVEADLVGQIVAGRLLAVGYALPRSPDDPLRYVPDDVWSGKIDFHASTVRGNGLEFISIRIIRPEAITGKPKEARRPGRPSRSDQVIAAFNALDAEDEIDRSTSLSSHFEAVRHRVKVLYPEGANSEKGLSNQLLYKVLKPLFKGPD